MRTHLLSLTAAVAGLGAITLAACSDETPTAAKASAAPASQLIAAPIRNTSSATPLVLPPEAAPVPSNTTRGTFEDDINVLFRIKEGTRTEVVNVTDPSQIVQTQITITANTRLPWHSHPGPAMVTVISGKLMLVDGETCTVREVDGTQADKPSFIDPGQGHVHTAYSPGPMNTVLSVTYLGVPKGQQALQPRPNPGC